MSLLGGIGHGSCSRLPESVEGVEGVEGVEAEP
jgi:hypothetical protein